LKLNAVETRVFCDLCGVAAVGGGFAESRRASSRAELPSLTNEERRNPESSGYIIDP
jgi:hypothetical protein